MTVFNYNDDDDDAVVSLTEPFMFLEGASVDRGGGWNAWTTFEAYFCWQY